jgi:hypothetical protein
MSDHRVHERVGLPRSHHEDTEQGAGVPDGSAARSTRLEATIGCARTVLQPVWRDWRIDSAAAVGVSASWGLLAGW